ncbi:MAG: TonB-dependent receptor [Proteobacteria bacterium]|jgi:iron complex outermembrane recepter protein|nr:TonB-dependent receptor [Pseudomonadota bacterium]
MSTNNHLWLGVRAVLMILFLGLGIAKHANAQSEATYLFDIPRLRADKALIQFAKQTKVTVLFPYEEARKETVGPLRGAFTVSQALEVLLQGSRIGWDTESTGNQEAVTSSQRGNLLPTGEQEKMFNNKIVPTVIALSILGSTSPVTAQVQGDSGQPVLEEIITIGTRSAKPRSAADSPVPVDVISAEDFSALGNTSDITDRLKALIPSYTATPATGDGSAFVRPTSLRGMSPDQTLILVNGKRRHRSALVQFFAPAAGNGSHGVDVGMIPAIALKNIEVLRDGAAAQYGSDAIAGVINFGLRDANEGGEVQVQYGEFYDGESSVSAAANFGLPLGDSGFVNISIERSDNDALSRGIQRPDAQALENAGVPGVGADAPFGDSPFVQTWGRPQTEATRLFINSAIELANGSELYAFGNYADTDGRYRFFYRAPGHSTIAALGLQGQLPAGYTPFLDGAQTDTSAVLGLRGVFDNEMTYDFSVGYGKNELDYFLNNTLNPGLALVNGQAQRNFDVGAYEQDEINLNADFSKQLSDNLYLSFGAEWREESFGVIAGEPNAVVNGISTSGFRAPTGSDIGTFSRDNFAAYVDIEHDISDAWLMQYALRFEDYSDFGSVITGKIASRFTVSDSLTLRGAVSTGFHAPTPGQTNIQTVITTFDGSTGLQVEEGLVSANSAAAQAAGGTALKEEESLNISAGFATSLGDNFDLTVDGYIIQVDDRIYRTGDIPVSDPRFNTVSFYTNAIDVESKGLDVVLSGGFDWGNNLQTDLSFAYSYNKVSITGQQLVGTIQPVSNSVVEDIENNYPNHRFTLTGNTYISDALNLMLRATYYGSHFDERGTINGSFGNQSSEIDAIIFVDAELGWQVNDNWRVVGGVANLFDSFVDEIPAGTAFANRQSVGLQYPRRTAANYEGGSWYLKGVYNF